MQFWCIRIACEDLSMWSIILTFMVNTVSKESMKTMVKVILKGNNQTKIDFKSRFMWEILFHLGNDFFFP